MSRFEARYQDDYKHGSNFIITQQMSGQISSGQTQDDISQNLVSSLKQFQLKVNEKLTVIVNKELASSALGTLEHSDDKYSDTDDAPEDD
ncbi:hypothetical protein MP228_002930 [Amoeboaphelidium protococcarum]|nr:hypothetical protein MP228_002930 [Amoeboaphelidium protococcarum]